MTKALLNKIVLAPDVFFLRIGNAKLNIRRALGQEDDTIIATRTSSRCPSITLNNDLFRLIQIFTKPVSISDAILAYVAITGDDPLLVLDRSFDFLIEIFNLGYLTPVKSPSNQKNYWCPQIGNDFSGWEILGVVQTLGNEIVCKVIQDEKIGCLKFRKIKTNASANAFHNEALILSKLPKQVVPIVFEHGRFNSHDYIITEWIEGSDALSFSKISRVSDVKLLRSVCVEIANAYSLLERFGVLHRDVHPRNIIVCPDGTIKLIDFTLASDVNAPSFAPHNGGVPYFLDPQRAYNRVHGIMINDSYSFENEQYSLAALIYLMITGSHYVEFELEHSRFYHQIISERPLSFSKHSLHSGTKLEKVLNKALAKKPQLRYPSLTKFSVAIGDAMQDLVAQKPAELARPLQASRTVASIVRDKFLKIRSDSNAGDRLDFHNGLAGSAFVCLRTASLLEDAELLERSDILISSAVKKIDKIYQYKDKKQIPTKSLGFHFSYSGAFLIAALIANARGDWFASERFAQRYLAEQQYRLNKNEFIGGRAGSLLSCLLLLTLNCDLASSEIYTDIQSHGNHIFKLLLTEICHDETTKHSSQSSLGIAHGSAGILYSLLAWDSKQCGQNNLILEKIANLQKSAHENLSTLSRSKRDDFTRAAWCTGASGFVHLFFLAAQAYTCPKFYDTALDFAKIAFTDSCKQACLCCGLAGRSYSLLRAYRETKDPVWLTNAEELSYRASKLASNYQHGLFKGREGIDLLSIEVKHPMSARMPLFDFS